MQGLARLGVVPGGRLARHCGPARLPGNAVTATRRPRTAKPAHSTLVLYCRNTVHRGGAQSLHSNIFFVTQSRTIKVFCDLNHILPVCDAMIAG